jgi:hypothetical protein
MINYLKTNKMKIEQTYVSFSQAKLLKEKGFNVNCTNAYAEERLINKSTGGDRFTGVYHLVTLSKFHKRYYSAPEQWQVVEWLRVNHGIWTHVHLEVKIKGLEISNTGKYQASINRVNHTSVFGKISEGDVPDGPYRKPQNSPQEAYSEAFDFVLTKLI